MQNYYKLLFLYHKAIGELRTFEESDDFLFSKGYLRAKTDTKRRGKKVYFHDSFYHVYKSYDGGESKKHHDYIRDENVEYVQGKLKNKKNARKIYKELKRKVKSLAFQLCKIFGVNGKLWNAALGYRETHEDFKEDEKGVVTALGELVRSRGECLIANLAYMFDMPFLYEYALKLRGKTYHPDFTFKVNGKTVLLEFAGMSGKEDYDRDWLHKLYTYSRNGYKIGENLVCISCEHKQKINSQVIAQVLLDFKEGKLPGDVVYV